MWIGRNRKARVTYGFDEIALVPGEVTINPLEVDTSFQIPRKDGTSITLKIPIIASVNCTTLGGWISYARQISEAGADALELNIYRIPTQPEVTGGAIEET